MKKQHLLFLLYTAVGMLLYYALGYHTQRENFLQYFLLFSACFGLYYFQLKSNLTQRQILSAGLLFRAVFIVCLPFLSQDYFRFIWDGHMMIQGINPYILKPQDLVNTFNGYPTHFYSDLHKGMGNLSAVNYSNYAPVNQLLFYWCSFFGGNLMITNVICLRLLIVAADVGIFYAGKRLLQKINKPVHLASLYFLNPLIIIELTGNLHFEGVMIFFLACGWLFTLYSNPIRAGIYYALAICIKLVPLMLLPFLLRKLALKELVIFFLTLGLSIVAFCIPFFQPGTGTNYLATVSLWFKNFEFNASIYYLLREAGFYLTGYNQIALLGKLMAFFAFFIIMWLALRKNFTKETGWFANMLLALFSFYMLSTTVHPWYISMLVFTCIFTNFRFPIVWSFSIALSYAAYRQPVVTEYPLLQWLEYLPVLIFFIWELYRRGGKKSAVNLQQA